MASENLRNSIPESYAPRTPPNPKTTTITIAVATAKATTTATVVDLIEEDVDLPSGDVQQAQRAAEECALAYRPGA